MTAYVIVEMEVVDSGAAEEYRKLAGASVPRAAFSHSASVGRRFARDEQ